MKGAPFTFSGIWLFVTALLVGGCSQGSITTQDEPPDAEEEPAGQDGGDAEQSDAGGDLQ